jgi:hypothetical protein
MTSDELRRLLGELDMDEREFAEALHVGYSTVRRWCGGGAVPPWVGPVIGLLDQRRELVEARRLLREMARHGEAAG